MRSLAPLFFLMTLVSHFNLNAQSFYAARRERPFIFIAGVGTSTYFGELANTGKYSIDGLNINVGLQYIVTDRLSVRSEITWFEISGDDDEANDEGRRVRNLSFSSSNLEAAVTGHITLIPQGRAFYKRPSLNVYGFGGVGFLWFNPTTKLNGETYRLASYKTEGVSYSRLGIAIPFGLGVKFKVNPYINITLEGGYRKTFTDYLDDVSTTFPGDAAFSDPIAAALSNRGPEIGYFEFKEGSKRGEPENRDGYFLLSAKVEYYLPWYQQSRRVSYKKYKKRTIRRPAHR
jgi:hypothetical protein